MTGRRATVNTPRRKHWLDRWPILAASSYLLGRFVLMHLVCCVLNRLWILYVVRMGSLPRHGGVSEQISSTMYVSHAFSRVHLTWWSVGRRRSSEWFRPVSSSHSFGGSFLFVGTTKYFISWENLRKTKKKPQRMFEKWITLVRKTVDEFEFKRFTCDKMLIMMQKFTFSFSTCYLLLWCVEMNRKEEDGWIMVTLNETLNNRIIVVIIEGIKRIGYQWQQIDDDGFIEGNRKRVKIRVSWFAANWSPRNRRRWFGRYIFYTYIIPGRILRMWSISGDGKIQQI